MTEPTTPSRQAAGRIGQHLKSGWTNYVDHWQEWIVPTLVAATFLVFSMLCCCFPYFIVVGPITCGLYCCAAKARRGGAVDVSDLNRGWHTPGRSILAALVINLGMALPMLLIYGLFFALIGLVIALAPQPTGPPSQRHDHRYEQQAEATVDTDAADRSRSADGAEPVSSDDLPDPSAEPDARPSQDAEQEQSRREDEPSPEAVFAMLLGMFVFYAVLFLAIILGWLWMLWFGTRTMFVFPLIAERQWGFAAAWSESWRETRIRFWELLIVNFVAGLLGMLGMYAMYIGLIFTMPIMFSIIMSVYDERFSLHPVKAENEPSDQGQE